MDFSRFAWITFDCYGTLIDWESGILRALGELAGRHGQNPSDSRLLELYAALESEAERGAYRTYREVLAEVMRGIGRKLRFQPTAEEIASLAESLAEWKPFPDTVAALGRLKTRYKLGVISNVDDDLFAGTARRLEVPFDEVVTAQQAESYKPSRRNFELALERIGVGPERVLHAAQSLFHDIATAKAMGFTTVWVNRASRAMPGRGATPAAAAAKPDLEVRDLETLAKLAVP